MKQFCFLLVLLISCASAHAQGSDTLNQKNDKGKQGHWIYYGIDRPEAGIPPEGKVEEGNYINDRKEGLWIKYHRDGKTPKIMGEYENNRPTAHYKKFYPSGQLREEGNFILGRYNDSLIRYYENGQREYASFTDSSGTLLWESYWNPDGTIQDKKNDLIQTFSNSSECSFKSTSSKKRPDRLPILNDPGEAPNTLGVEWNPNGTNKVYSDSGILIMEGKFKHGLLSDGKLYYYDYKGNLTKIYLLHGGMFSDEIQGISH